MNIVDLGLRSAVLKAARDLGLQQYWSPVMCAQDRVGLVWKVVDSVAMGRETG